MAVKFGVEVPAVLSVMLYAVMFATRTSPSKRLNSKMVLILDRVTFVVGYKSKPNQSKTVFNKNHSS